MIPGSITPRFCNQIQFYFKENEQEIEGIDLIKN